MESLTITIFLDSAPSNISHNRRVHGCRHSNHQNTFTPRPHHNITTMHKTILGIEGTAWNLSAGKGDRRGCPRRGDRNIPASNRWHPPAGSCAAPRRSDRVSHQKSDRISRRPTDQRHRVLTGTRDVTVPKDGCNSSPRTGTLAQCPPHRC